MYIALRPSRVLAVVLIFAHGLTAAVVVFTVLPMGWMMPTIMAVLLTSLTLGLHGAMLRRFDAIVVVKFSEDGTLSTQNKRGHWVECDTLSSTYVSKLLIVLNLRLENGKIRHMTILPDAIDPEDFRALRVWLRWKAGQNTKQRLTELP